jgi:CBS domain-containing protein
MKARDIMTSNPEVVTPDDPVGRAAQIMRDSGVGIVPVVDDHNAMRLQGVITDRDIAIRHVAQDCPSTCTVRDHMTSDRIEATSPDSDIDDILEVMERDQIRRIPVLEENYRLVGIIAQADIATRGVSEKDVGQLVERVSEPTAPNR